MVLPETALNLAPSIEPTALDEQPTGASGVRFKVATRPATVGATWLDLFHPGTPCSLSLEARVRVVADVAGALIQIHENSGVPRQHRRHGRLTPRHLLVGVDGSASLFNAKQPFSKLLPPQPDLGYLAPELLTQSGPANQQSDVFSMGVLLWEALDNGRLFPHRRAASISRLIARRSLPTPRIEEEWALPLGDVALKALACEPGERYADGTAFWLALREHLPAPDNARAALAQLAQSALKLELTSEIRDYPPYLVPSRLLLGGSLPPGRARSNDSSAPDAPARYSLHPEPSSRQPGPMSRPPLVESSAWSILESPSASARAAAPRSSDQQVSRAPSTPQSFSQPPPARAPAAAPVASPSTSAPPSASAPPSPSEAPISPPASSQWPNGRLSSPPSPQAPASEPPISTLHVNLPRDLIDTSLPFYVSSQAPPRPFPWGALSFAALIFFGVGAAVAFGAVTALRTFPSAVLTPAPGAPAVAVPAAPSARPAESVPSASESTPAQPALPDSVPTAALPQITPELAPIDSKPPPTAAAAPPRKPSRRASKPARAKHPAVPSATPAPEPSSEIQRELDDPSGAETAPELETSAKGKADDAPALNGAAKPGEEDTTSLPFVNQPY
jgi:hypothetical protein